MNSKNYNTYWQMNESSFFCSGEILETMDAICRMVKTNQLNPLINNLIFSLYDYLKEKGESLELTHKSLYFSSIWVLDRLRAQWRLDGMGIWVWDGRHTPLFKPTFIIPRKSKRVEHRDFEKLNNLLGKNGIKSVYRQDLKLELTICFSKFPFSPARASPQQHTEFIHTIHTFGNWTKTGIFCHLENPENLEKPGISIIKGLHIVISSRVSTIFPAKCDTPQ